MYLPTHTDILVGHLSLWLSLTVNKLTHFMIKTGSKEQNTDAKVQAKQLDPQHHFGKIP